MNILKQKIMCPVDNVNSTIFVKLKELDGVGPVDNRPSTN